MNGKGHLKWPDGREYDGSFLDDKRHGEGTFTWKDGRQYTGNWKEGKQHGLGHFRSSANSKKQKKGEWVDGKRVRWIEDDENTYQ